MTDVSTETDKSSPTAFVSARQQLHRSDLENVLQTTRPQGWWALAVATIMIISATVWAFVAEIPQTVTSIGVVDALVYSYDVTAPAAGTVQYTGIKGGIVSAGESLGSVMTPDGKNIPIIVQRSGEVTSVGFSQNAFVQLGATLLTVTSEASTTSPVEIVAFIGESAMVLYPMGATVEISSTDVVSGRTVYATATIVAEGSTPSMQSTLNDTNGNLASLTNQWLEESSGYPYALFLESKDWPMGDSGFIPRGGQIVSISHTYDTVHPITQLFGGK